MVRWPQVCANRDRLFELQKGEEFVCQFDEAAFDELHGWLASGPAYG